MATAIQRPPTVQEAYESLTPQQREQLKTCNKPRRIKRTGFPSPYKPPPKPEAIEQVKALIGQMKLPFWLARTSLMVRRARIRCRTHLGLAWRERWADGRRSA